MARDETLSNDGVLSPLLRGMTQTFRWQYIPFHTHVARLIVFGVRQSGDGEGLSGGLETKAGLSSPRTLSSIRERKGSNVRGR